MACTLGLRVITSYFAKAVMHKQDWGVYTCLTQLYGGRDIYNLLHKDQLHVSVLFIGHLLVDNWKT